MKRRRTWLLLGGIVVLVLVSVAFLVDRPGNAPSPTTTLVQNADSKKRIELLLTPEDDRPGIVMVNGTETDAFLAVDAKGESREIWTGEDGGAWMGAAADNSALILVELSHDGIHTVKTGRVHVLSRAGDPLFEYSLDADLRPAYALPGGSLLAIRTTGTGDKLVLLDKNGKIAGQTGPFFLRGLEISRDGTRAMVNVGERAGGSFRKSASAGVLVVDLKTQSVLHRLPPTPRCRLSPLGDLVVATGESSVSFWRNGKQAGAIALPSPSTLPVFSASGSHVGFNVGDQYCIYETESLKRTVSVTSPKGYRFHGSRASLSDRGTLLIALFPADENSSRSWWVHLYTRAGILAWRREFKRASGKNSLRGLRIASDGRSAYFMLPGRVERVDLPESALN